MAIFTNPDLFLRRKALVMAPVTDKSMGSYTSPEAGFVV